VICTKIEGKDEETRDLKNMSPEAKALFIFANGKKPIDVAIELGLSTSASTICKKNSGLCDLHELAFVYDEIEAFLASFLKLFHCLRKNKMLSEKFISGILRYVGNDLPQLTDGVQWLSTNIIYSEGQKRNLMNKLILWNA
jgi:hypothetical protein